MNNMLNIIEFLELLNKFFEKEKKKLYFIGGASRNIVNRKILPQDLDFSTNANPNETENILRQFKKVFTNLKIITIGKEFGTISFFGSFLNEKKDKKESYSFEITSARKDVKCFGRKAEVEFCEDFFEDSRRRDFTINAIYVDLKSFLENKKNNVNFLKILDFHNSLKDLKNKQINFIGNAEKRIEEDYLRIIRYVRFCCLYDCNLDEDIVNLCKKNVSFLKNLSKERKKKEIWTIISYKSSIDGIFNLINCDILPFKLKKKISSKNLKFLLNLKKKSTANVFDSCFEIIFLIKFLFIFSVKNEFTDNLNILKENISFDKSEKRVMDFYVENFHLLNIFFSADFKEMERNFVQANIFETFYKANRKNYDFYKKQQNWKNFFSLFEGNKLLNGKIFLRIDKCFLFFYLVEFSKNEFFIFEAFEDIYKEHIGFLKRLNKKFTSEGFLNLKKKIISSTSNKELISSYLQMLCIL